MIPKTKTVDMGESIRAHISRVKEGACSGSEPDEGNVLLELAFSDGYQSDLMDQKQWSYDQADAFDEQLRARLPQGAQIYWGDRELFEVQIPKSATADPVTDLAAALRHAVDHPLEDTNSPDGFVFGQASQQAAQALAVAGAGPLAGIAFAFTGKLERGNREEAGQLVTSLGGKVTSDVSAKTSYLVSGDRTGSKLDRAQALGVTVLDEGQFYGMIAEHQPHLSSQ